MMAQSSKLWREVPEVWRNPLEVGAKSQKVAQSSRTWREVPEAWREPLKVSANVQNMARFPIKGAIVGAIGIHGLCVNQQK